jgi:hypothetical protein
MRPWPARVASVVVALALLVVALTDAGVSHTGGRAEAIQGNTTIQSFHKAKTLAREVFAGHERTFYCDCPYSGTTGDLTSCGYQPKKTRERAECLEWEHVVPADAFGQSFVEWREGNPECVDRKGHAFKFFRPSSVRCCSCACVRAHSSKESPPASLFRAARAL